MQMTAMMMMMMKFAIAAALLLVAGPAAAANPSDELEQSQDLLASHIARVSVYGSACAPVPDWLREQGAKIIGFLVTRKMVEDHYVLMTAAKDKMGAEAWCKSAKPYIDFLIFSQPPLYER